MRIFLIAGLLTIGCGGAAGPAAGMPGGSSPSGSPPAPSSDGGSPTAPPAGPSAPSEGEVAPIAAANALTLPAQRHLIRIDATYLLALQQDGAQQRGLDLFRSDDDGATWRRYAT